MNERKLPEFETQGEYLDLMVQARHFFFSFSTFLLLYSQSILN